MPAGVYKRINIRNMGKYWVGKKRPIETRLKMRASARTGEKNWQWQGEKVNYRNLHRWVERWKGKANHCEVCGKIKAKRFQWANVDHQYRRILEDYISMCVSCHMKYDKTNNKRTKK